MAVVFAVVVVLLVLFGVASIGGSYALTLSAIHRQEVTQTQVRAREATAQIRLAVPTCKAIDSMDRASHIPPQDFPKPPHNTYDKRLSAAIHNVNVTSHCPLILHDVYTHVPFTEILRQIQNPHGSSSAHRNAGSQG